MSLSLVACRKQYAFFDEGGGRHQWPAIVRSNQTQFDIDSVELEFGFGHSSNPVLDFSQEFEPINFSVYFAAENSTSNIHDGVVDYHNIGQGWLFVKSIALEEFYSDNYKITKRWFANNKYNHFEMIKLSSQIFEPAQNSNIGSVYFVVMGVYLHKSNNLYYFTSTYRQVSGVSFDFQKIGDQIYFGDSIKE